MSDPDHIFRDPQFPDRPDTEDFWRLSSTVLRIDGALSEALPEERDGIFTRLVGEVIDMDALGYTAVQRALRRADTLDAAVAAATAYVDGFVAGANYQKEYGV